MRINPQQPWFARDLLFEACGAANHQAAFSSEIEAQALFADSI
jgi:hypothetical protein